MSSGYAYDKGPDGPGSSLRDDAWKGPRKGQAGELEAARAKKLEGGDGAEAQTCGADEGWVPEDDGGAQDRSGGQGERAPSS